jgi:hypothetical protein
VELRCRRAILSPGSYRTILAFHKRPDGFLARGHLPGRGPGSTRATGRPLYLKAFAALQEAWLAQHPNRFSAQRWRTLHWLTPFGPIRLPTRVVRDKASGRYLTLSKVFLCPKATRLLSTALQQEACAAATEQNHRPAALRRGRGRTPAPVQSGSGAVEKNIEMHIHRRFKRQGRSGHPLRAERLLALGQLLAQPQAWTQGWKSKPQFHIQPNPP